MGNFTQANFRNEAMLRQHEEGPAHRKAVAKDKARREREAWMENPSAAANALVSHCVLQLHYNRWGRAVYPAGWPHWRFGADSARSLSDFITDTSNYQTIFVAASRCLAERRWSIETARNR